MPVSPHPVSRRGFLTTGATLLAGFGVSTLLPERRAGAVPAAAPSAARADLARFRPVSVSSTDYAPTPAAFAVDDLAEVGVKGTGWRAAAGDPQWISVDLQVPCTVEAVSLVFEATLDDPAFDGNYSQTYGSEVLSSAAVSFTIDVSTDGDSWQTVYATTSGTGGARNIALDQPVTARWVRMTSSKRSNSNPVGLNGFQVYGTPSGPRPEVTGWTDWSDQHPSSPTLETAGDGTVALESGWELTIDDFAGDADGAALSRHGADVDRWLSAQVPGTVLASLVAQDKFADPVSGFHNLHIPEALSRHDWWYRRTFSVPADLATGRGRRLWLEFDGITHSSQVWVNGASVGSTPNPFTRGIFDITQAVKTGRTASNVVAVQVKPMPHPGTPGDKSSNGNTFVQGGHLYLDSPTYLAASGWDWMPAVRDRVTGIWNHVRLRSTGTVVMGDLRVQTALPKLPDRDVATVAITVPVRNVGTRSESVTIRATFGAVSVARTVTVAAGESTDVAFTPDAFAALTLRRPQLWWPNGYGDPTLHELMVTARTGAGESDHRAVRFGIRQFDYSYDEPVKVPPSTAPTFIVSSGSDAPGQIVDLGAQHARYVRLALGQRATGYGFSMYRLAVVDSDHADTDLALHKNATASSNENDGYDPNEVTDGDNTTRWASTYQDDQWIQVDLGAATDFDQVRIAWENAYALTFAVQVSDDGSSWTDVKDVDNATALGDSAVQTETFAAQHARYLRILCQTRATGYGSSMWRLSAFDSDHPDTDVALHKSATASSDDGDNDAAQYAVDGNPRTRWSSAYQDDQWIQVDLGSTVTFDTVQIDWEQAYAATYVIQASDDASTWTDVKSVDNSITQLSVKVNGVRVFCRGGNWGWDELLRRTQGRLETAVRMHRDMNFTMIRNWLGSSDREELYALCDEYGLLVWNDFWEAGSFNDDIPGYVDAVTETITRYRTHPSIVVWCGANEEVPPGHLDAGMRQAVADHDGEIIYLSSSADGIVSGHGPYRWIDPAAYFDKSSYDRNTFGFHTEIGMPVISTVESMRNLVGGEPEWPISEVWNYHDWSETANQQTSGYKSAIDTRLGESSNLAEFCRRAQFVNYESSRAMFEAWNANLWQDATGLLLWMSHPAWHSTVWQTYDYDFDVNGAYYGSRKGCEPVHVQASLPDWRVLVANHTTERLVGATLSAELRDLRGRKLGTKSRTVSVGASAAEPQFAMPFGADLPALHLLRLELHDGGGRLLSENVYWRYRQASDMTQLNTLKDTTLQLSTVRGSAGAPAVSVRNTGATVAAMVRLSARDAAGDRVLPTLYSDNYLWLLPGEKRTVTLTPPAGAGPVRVVADAYNAAQVTTG